MKVGTRRLFSYLWQLPTPPIQLLRPKVFWKFNKSFYKVHSNLILPSPALINDIQLFTALDHFNCDLKYLQNESC